MIFLKLNNKVSHRFHRHHRHPALLQNNLKRHFNRKKAKNGGKELKIKFSFILMGSLSFARVLYTSPIKFIVQIFWTGCVIKILWYTTGHIITTTGLYGCFLCCVHATRLLYICLVPDIEIVASIRKLD